MRILAKRKTTTQQFIEDIIRMVLENEEQDANSGFILHHIAQKAGLTKDQMRKAAFGYENEIIFQKILKLFCSLDLNKKKKMKNGGETIAQLKII